MAQPAKRPYLPELDIVRAIGIMAVIMIHATSSIVATYDHNGALYPIYVFLNVSSKFAVPVFIFLSGFVLFYNYYDKSFTVKTIGEFYRKRISKVIVPFLFFSFFYWAITRYINYGFTDVPTFISYFTSWSFIHKLIIGKTYTHLYFVVIIIQFYVLAPFILLAVKRFPSLGKHIVWIGLIIHWLFIYKIAVMLELTNRGSYAFTYMFYFVAGAFIGMNYMKLVKWIHVTKQNASPKKVAAWILLWALFIAAGLTQVIFFYEKYLTDEFIMSTKLLELINEVHSLTAAIVLLQLSHWIYTAWNSRAVRTLIHIGATSFGIYLLHPLVLIFYRKIDMSGSPLLFHLWVAGGFLAALLIPWLIVSISARSKWHWLLFGPLPAKKKPAPALPKQTDIEA